MDNGQWLPLLATAGAMAQPEADIKHREDCEGDRSSRSTRRATAREPDYPPSLVIARRDGRLSGVGRASLACAAGRSLDATMEVQDLSQTDNLHLDGPGADEATSVTAVEGSAFEVTLEQGSYRFLCNPHPNMRGDVEVG